MTTLPQGIRLRKLPTRNISIKRAKCRACNRLTAENSSHVINGYQFGPDCYSEMQKRLSRTTSAQYSVDDLLSKLNTELNSNQALFVMRALSNLGLTGKQEVVRTVEVNNVKVQIYKVVL